MTVDTLRRCAEWMQRMDPNGDHATIMDEMPPEEAREIMADTLILWMEDAGGNMCAASRACIGWIEILTEKDFLCG